MCHSATAADALFWLACLATAVCVYYLFAARCDLHLRTSELVLSAHAPGPPPSLALNSAFSTLDRRLHELGSPEAPLHKQLVTDTSDEINPVPWAEPPAVPSNYSLTRQAFFVHPYEPSSAAGAYDSLAESVIIQGKYPNDQRFEYNLCVLRNVCVSERGYHFHFSNLTQWTHYKSVLEACHDGSVKSHPPSSVCACFHDNNRALLMPFDGEVTTPSPFRFMNAESAGNSGGNDRDHHHAFVVHKWVKAHHIAHWMQKLLMLQSIMQHWSELVPLNWLTSDAKQPLFPPLPKSSPSFVDKSSQHLARPFSHLVFQDSDSQLTDHELAILRVSMLTAWGPQNKLVRELLTQDGTLQPQYRTSSSLVDALALAQKVIQQAFVSAHVYFAPELATGLYRTDTPLPLEPPGANAPASPGYTCFPRVTFSPTYARFASAPQDLVAWRQAAYDHLNLGNAKFPLGLVAQHVGFRLSQLSKPLQSHASPIQPRRQCPPRRAIFLTRHNRVILNRQEIIDWAHDTFRVNLETVSISGDSSAFEQSQLFASSGLVISAHSSQTVNVVFSHPGSCVVEVAPEFWNDDFPAYAASVGVKYRYAFGGMIFPPTEFTFSQAHVDCLARLAPCDGDGGCVMANAHKCPLPRHGPNKRKNFLAGLARVKHAIHQCLRHLNWQCYGRWTP